MLKIISQKWPPRPPAVDPTWTEQEFKNRRDVDRGFAHIFGTEQPRPRKKWDMATFMKELRQALTRLPITFMSEGGPTSPAHPPIKGNLLYQSKVRKFAIGLALDEHGFGVFIENVYDASDVPPSHAPQLIERSVREIEKHL